MNPRPRHLWIVGIVSLLWNAFGAFDYLATQLRLGFYMSQFTPEQLAYFENLPKWAVSAWALGVWGAFAGSVGLLLAKRWAVAAFLISIAGLAVNTIYTHLLSDWAKTMGSSDLVLTSTIWVIAIALLWYSFRQRANGNLGPA